MDKRKSYTCSICRALMLVGVSYLTFGNNGMLGMVNAEENRDFYKILGIKRNATEREIKKAFKKKSLENHPDKNPDDKGAKQRFQDVGAAYEVLTDQEKRRKYDKCGEKCVNEQGGGHDPFDPFADFFGGGRGGNQERTGPNMNVKVKVTLEDIYSGKEMEIKYTR